MTAGFHVSYTGTIRKARNVYIYLNNIFIYISRLNQSTRHNSFCDSEFHAYAIIRQTLMIVSVKLRVRKSYVPLIRSIFRYIVYYALWTHQALYRKDRLHVYSSFKTLFSQALALYFEKVTNQKKSYKEITV